MEDLNLRESEIQSLSHVDAIVAFFASLGYSVERLQQTPAALGITNDTLIRNIQHVEQIAVQDGELYIYLFVMKSMRLADRQALAKTFRNADGEYLLVLTADYESIDFVLLERVLPRDSAGNPMVRKEVLVQQHVLTVNRRNPGRVALRVLRRFTYTEADVFYQIDKLLSAYTIAQWSRPMFNNLALFSDYFLEHRLQDSSEWREDALPIHGRLNNLFRNKLRIKSAYNQEG